MRIFFGWWQVAVALLLNAVSSASIFTAYSVIAVPLEQTFEPSRTMLMMGVTVANLAAGALSPFAGAAIDRFSIRVLMFAGTVVLGAGFALLSVVDSMIQVIPVYLFLAIATVLAGPMAASALLARWFTRNRGLAISLAASGGAIGGLIIPPVLQFLIDTFEWRTALQIYGAALFLITGPIVGLLITNRPSDRNLHPEGDCEPPPPASGGAHERAASIFVFLRNRNFWLLALCLGTLFSGPMGLLSNLVPFGLEKGLTAAQGALLLSIFSGANFAGKLVSGPVADRVDYRFMLGALMLLMSLCFFGFQQSGGFMLIALVTALIGACQGSIVPLWSITLARVYGPDNMGRSMGLMSVAIMPFTLVAAPFFGWSYDARGSYNTALTTYMLVLLGALVVVAMIRREPIPPAAAVST